MNIALKEIAERIRGGTDDLDATVLRIQRMWAVVQRGIEERDPYLDSVALNLHSFYSGFERLLEMIAKTVDQITPNGESWHRDLLQQMARDIPHIRPAVISPENVKQLEEFRRFRHLVRNVYASELIPERMTGMLTNLPGLWRSVRAELIAFAEFLDQAS